jgi:hypothetical protein
MHRNTLLGTLTAMSLLLAATPGIALAQHDHEAHPMHGAGGAVAQLQLNAGQKWPTDAPLRAGMADIRVAFDTDHPAIHAGKQSDAQYAALAERIEQQVKSIVAQCKLPADADANLHLVVADLLQGATFMRGEDGAHSRHDGAALVHGALRAYGQYFDDPAWKPDMPMHGQ